MVCSCLLLSNGLSRSNSVQLISFTVMSSPRNRVILTHDHKTILCITYPCQTALTLPSKSLLSFTWMKCLSAAKHLFTFDIIKRYKHLLRQFENYLICHVVTTTQLHICLSVFVSCKCASFVMLTLFIEKSLLVYMLSCHFQS